MFTQVKYYWFRFGSGSLTSNLTVVTKDGSTVRYVGRVRYASIFAKKYGTLVRYAFFVMVRVRYVGTVRLLYDGMGTVRWYAVWISEFAY